MPDEVSVLAEQRDYYAALASHYGENAIQQPGGDELIEALERFRPTGKVLELACGPGTWTPTLLRHAQTVTALDASNEMLAVARRSMADPRVRFIQADVFEWQPDDSYDTVFFGFWISHVPPERFESFWSLVGDCLAEQGRVFFFDDAYRTREELVFGETSPIIERRLKDGRTFRIIKVPHEQSELEARLANLGWRIAVHATAGPFYWGEGRRA